MTSGNARERRRQSHSRRRCQSAKIDRMCTRGRAPGAHRHIVARNVRAPSWLGIVCVLPRDELPVSVEAWARLVVSILKGDMALISCGGAAFFLPHCSERPFPSPHLKSAGRSNSRLGLSAGFEGCTRHPLRAWRQLRQTFSGRSALARDAAKPEGHAAPPHKC